MLYMKSRHTRTRTRTQILHVRTYFKHIDSRECGVEKEEVCNVSTQNPYKLQQRNRKKRRTIFRSLLR